MSYRGYPLARTAALIALLTVTGCPSTGVTPTTHLASTSKPSSGPTTKPSGGAIVASPGLPAVSAFTGLVLDQNGAPAVGVLVRATAIGENSSGIVAQGGGNIVAQGGGNIVAQGGGNAIGENSSGIVAQGGGNYHTLATGTAERLLADTAATADAAASGPGAIVTSTKTDATGHFVLTAPASETLGVEAVQSDSLKAIKLGVKLAAGAAPFTLQLAPVGNLQGTVTAPKAPAVTDFTGVDVYVPGTSYAAKTAKDGSYSIANVPAGAFSMIGSKTGLGSAQLDNVLVVSGQTTQAPNLALDVVAPTLTGVTPANALAGATLTLTGTNFGASSGATFTVTIGGVAVASPQRTSDTVIQAVVPTSVAAGAAPIVVTVDGIPSAPLAFAAHQKLLQPTGDLLAGSGNGLRDGTGVDASFSFDAVGGLVSAPDGTLYMADGRNHCVRTIVADGSGSYIVTGLAGDFKLGTDGSLDGPAASARFSSTEGLALDAAQNILYVADYGNSTIRAIDLKTDGHPVTTLAGKVGVTGNDDLAGLDATFNGPAALALDGHGGLIITDDYNLDVRRLDLTNPSHPVTTIAGTAGVSGNTNGVGAAALFSNPHGVVVAPDGTIYIADTGNSLIRKLTPGAGGSYTSTTYAGGADRGDRDGAIAQALFNFPTSLALAPDGTLYVGESLAEVDSHTVATGGRIRVISPAGLVSTVAGGGSDPTSNTGLASQLYLGATAALTLDPTGNLLFLDDLVPNASVLQRIRLVQ